MNLRFDKTLTAGLMLTFFVTRCLEEICIGVCLHSFVRLAKIDLSDTRLMTEVLFNCLQNILKDLLLCFDEFSCLVTQLQPFID